MSTSFKSHMRDKYTFPPTNSARGIDFPEFDVGIKVQHEAAAVLMRL